MSDGLFMVEVDENKYTRTWGKSCDESHPPTAIPLQEGNSPAGADKESIPISKPP
jgi:hypothetical protein